MSRRAGEVVAWVGLALVVVVAVVVRWPALAPNTLWLDDAWVALVARADDPAEFARLTFTVPGFTALVWGTTDLAGLSSLSAQAPALVAGIVAVPVAWATARRLGARVPAALLAASLVAVAPAHVVYSTRVKAYTTEVLLALVLILLAADVVEEPNRPRRWGVLTVVAVVATCVSATLAFAVSGVVVAGLVAAWPRGGSARRSAVVAAAAYGVFAAGFWWAVVRPVPDSLRAYWSSRYLPLDDLGVAAHRFVDGSRVVLEALLPLPAPVGAILVVLALAVATRRRPALGLGLLTMVVAAVAAALVGAAPWGSGRTELFLLAPVAVAIAIAVDAPAPRWWSHGVVGAAVGALLVVAVTADPVRYPAYDVRPFITAAEDADVAVLVYPSTRWAYGLYTSADVDLVEDADDSWRVTPGILDPDVTVLPVAGVFDPDAYRESVQDAVAGEDRVMLVASHFGANLDGLDAVIRAEGFRAWTAVGGPGRGWSRTCATVPEVDGERRTAGHGPRGAVVGDQLSPLALPHGPALAR